MRLLVLSLLLLALGAANPCCLAADSAKGKDIPVVYAVKQIDCCKTISKNDLAVKNVPADSLPKGLLPKDAALKANAESFYVSTIKEAAGRNSKGIRKGEILYFNSPDFRGSTVVMAKKDIPEGREITADFLEEKELNPNDISPAAAYGMADVVGKLSRGIEKGNIVTWVYGKGNEKFRAGEAPGPSPRKHYAVATKDIAVGKKISKSDFEHGTTRYERWNPGRIDTYIEEPEGYKVTRAIQQGQIITKYDAEK